MCFRLKCPFGNKRGQSVQVASALDTPVSPLAALSDADVPSSPQVPQQIHSVNVSPASVVHSTEVSASTVVPASVATAVLDGPREFSCFQFIYDVMDELWPQSEADYPDRVKAEVRQLSDEYQRLDHHSDVRYDAQVRRMAYLYAYASVRAVIVSDILQHCQESPMFHAGGCVRLACIGGGPGTEVIGVAKYLASTGLRAQIDATVYDREPGWKEIIQHCELRLRGWMDVNIRLREVDITAKSASCSSHVSIADLYTISYCMSQFRNRQPEGDAFFSTLFHEMPSGAFCLFLDLNQDQELDWFDGLAARHSLADVPFLKGRTINQREEFHMPVGEISSARECFHGVLTPKKPWLTPSISYRLCQKQ